MTQEMYIIAYVYLDGILHITEEEAKKLTHVNLAFGLIGRDGLLCTDELRYLERIQWLRKVNPEIKIVLSVGGWGAGGFSTMAKTKEGRERFAQSCKEYVTDMNLDGIDIDWEYPGIDWAGIDAAKEDKENYTLLLQELRKVLPKQILSVAVGAGDYFIQNTEMEKVGQVCDYVQIMTYDMRNSGCFTAGHHTSLYAGEGDDTGNNVADAVKRFVAAGVPKEKIVIGAAFYAVVFDQVENCKHGLLQKAGVDGHGGPGYTELVENYINQNGYERFWDDVAKAPFLFDGKTFLTYDDPESIREKCHYLKQENLKGIMYWQHGLDYTHTLLGAIEL